MVHKLWVLIISLLSTVFTECINGATYDDVKTEYSKLVNAYTIEDTINGDPYSQTIPTDNLPIIVTLTLSIYSLAGFDPVAGTINIVGSLRMEWVDDIATASSPVVSFDSATVSSLFVDYSLIWTPTIVLVNSADSVESVGDSSYKARYATATGRVTWEPRVIFSASCTPDVSYFPFDEQSCSLTFKSWIYDSSLVQLQVGASEWGTDSFDENGVWTVDKTEARVVLENGYYLAKFDIDIRRNALYFTINIVFPILLLAVLSGSLFLIPAGSGERVGFGIISFLSFVVLLQVTMRFLPEASSPMSILCYYLILMMTLSAVLSIVNILLIKVHMTDENLPLPKWLVHFVEFIKCIKFKRWRQRRSQRQNDVESSVSFGELQRTGTDSNPSSGSSRSDSTEPWQLDRKFSSDAKVETKTDDVDADSECNSPPDQNGRETSAPENEAVDWRSVGEFLDFFFVLVFIGTQAALSVFFLAPLALRAT